MMKQPFYNLDNWKPIFPVHDDMAIDEDGHFNLRIENGMVLETDSGEMHFTTTWDSSDDFSSNDF